MLIRVGSVALCLALVGLMSTACTKTPQATPGKDDQDAAGQLPVDSGTGGAAAGDADASSSGSPVGSDAAPPSDGSDGAPCTPVASPVQPQVFSGEVSGVVAACGADGGAPRKLGAIATSTMLQMSIGLPVRNQAQLNAYLQGVSDPTSPIYRQYLTPQQYTDMYGPTACDYQVLVDWAQAQGFTVNTYSDRELLDVSGTATQFDAALHTTFGYYQRPDGSQFYAPDVDPSVDVGVAILAIDGLDNCVLPQPG
ncbi:MAG TPA: protease pro-enzyme activation domain-containing protein [Polyangiaceae bacterium]|nr:protease pro-enzyme activation domain-containing protein [Polyangiaceae bacterium]